MLAVRLQVLSQLVCRRTLRLVHEASDEKLVEVRDWLLRTYGRQ